jgi:hypothetical protein
MKKDERPGDITMSLAVMANEAVSVISTRTLHVVKHKWSNITLEVYKEVSSPK